MNNEYSVNNIFCEDGLLFKEIIEKYLLSFLDREFNIYEDCD